MSRVKDKLVTKLLVVTIDGWWMVVWGEVKRKNNTNL